MSRVKSKLTVLVLVGAVTIALLSVIRRGGSHASSLDEGQLDGRVWIEGRPDKLTDYVHAAYFLSRANFAFFDRGSSYDLRMEFADMTKKDGKVKVFFPQTKRSVETTFAVTECKDKAPFDLCLDLGENPWGGPKRYYGFSREEDERAALGARAGRIRAAVVVATSK